jgi:hypothetical protein
LFVSYLRRVDVSTLLEILQPLGRHLAAYALMTRYMFQPFLRFYHRRSFEAD